MPSVEKICDDLEVLSGKISDLTRTISLSVLALVWLFIAGGANAPTLRAMPNHGLLLLAGLFVLLSLLSDYLQFVAGYSNSKELLGIAEESESKQVSPRPLACSQIRFQPIRKLSVRLFSSSFEAVRSVRPYGSLQMRGMCSPTSKITASTKLAIMRCLFQLELSVCPNNSVKRTQTRCAGCAAYLGR